MNDEQIFEAIGRGCCTEKKAIENGCAVCAPMYEAVAIVRKRFAELETTKRDLEEARLGCDVLSTGAPFDRLGTTLDALARLRKAARVYVEVAEAPGLDTMRDVARDALEAEIAAGSDVAPDAYRVALLRLVEADEATFGALNPADAMEGYDLAIVAARELLGIGELPLASAARGEAADPFGGELPPITPETLARIAEIGAQARVDGDHEAADYADAVLYLSECSSCGYAPCMCDQP